MTYIFILTVGLIAGTIGGVVGTGSSIMLLPVLIYEFGPRQAVPIMAIAAIMANVARAMAWWREVDWRAVIAYSIPGVPMAAFGARTLLALPSRTVDIAIGVFLLSMIPARHWLAANNIRLPYWSLVVVGAVAGFLTGIVASTGPITVPIFMTFGLLKGPLLGTEAAASLAIYLSKALTFQRLDALPWEVFVKGLIAGSSLFAGAFIARRFVVKLAPDSFRLMMDALMFVAGIAIIWNAFA